MASTQNTVESVRSAMDCDIEQKIEQRNEEIVVSLQAEIRFLYQNLDDGFSVQGGLRCCSSGKYKTAGLWKKIKEIEISGLLLSGDSLEKREQTHNLARWHIPGKLCARKRRWTLHSAQPKQGSGCRSYTKYSYLESSRVQDVLSVGWGVEIRS